MYSALTVAPLWNYKKEDVPDYFYSHYQYLYTNYDSLTSSIYWTEGQDNRVYHLEKKFSDNITYDMTHATAGCITEETIVMPSTHREAFEREIESIWNDPDEPYQWNEDMSKFEPINLGAGCFIPLKILAIW